MRGHELWDRCEGVHWGGGGTMRGERGDVVVTSGGEEKESRGRGGRERGGSQERGITDRCCWISFGSVSGFALAARPFRSSLRCTWLLFCSCFLSQEADARRSLAAAQAQAGDPKGAAAILSGILAAPVEGSGLAWELEVRLMAVQVRRAGG